MPSIESLIRNKGCCVALAALVCLTAATAAADDGDDAQAGEILARQCSVCHGKQGISNDPEVPHLAGQPALYLEKSLNDFINGTREDRRMSLVVKTLSQGRGQSVGGVVCRNGPRPGRLNVSPTKAPKMVDLYPAKSMIFLSCCPS